MDLECCSCFIKSLLSALWLVDDSAAVSLRCVLTRNWWCSSAVLPAVFLVTRTHEHPHISSHRPLKTSSHPAVHIHVSPILTCCIVENPSEVVPSFQIVRTLGAFQLPFLRSSTHSPLHRKTSTLWHLHPIEQCAFHWNLLTFERGLIQLASGFKWWFGEAVVDLP